MKKQAFRGAVWTLIDTLGGQVLAFVAFALLARLLLPDDYGVVTLAAVLIAVPSIVLNEGLATALVQADNVDDARINAAFWANLVLSFIFVGIAQIAAPWAAELTHTPVIEPVLRWLSLNMVTTALMSIAGALYMRDLDYSTFALRTLISTTAGAIVAIAMVLSGFTVLALVAQQLVGNVIGVIVLWKGIKWRPSFRFSWDAMRDLYRFAFASMLGNGLRFCVEKSDCLIVGIFLDAKSLGYYYLVLRLITTINSFTLSPVDNIMLPVLSRMKDDPKLRATTFANMIGVASALWVPALAGLGMISPMLLPMLFGHKWDEAIPMMMIASLAAISGPLTRPFSQLFYAAGYPHVYVQLNLIQLALTVGAFLIGVQYGIIGAAWAYAIVLAIMVPFNLWAAEKVAQVPATAVLSRYLPTLAAGGIMALALCLVMEFTKQSYFMLGFEIVTAVVVYATALYGLAPALVKEFLHNAYDALPRRLQIFAPSGAAE